MQIILGPFSGLPPSPNATQGQHWSKLRKIKQEWQETVGITALAYKAQQRLRGTMDTAHIHFDIQVGDNRTRDPDNLQWAVTKPALDGLKKVLITDDDIDHISLSYTFSRAKPAQFTITLTGD